MEFSFTREQLLFKNEVVRFARKEIVPRVEAHELTATFDLEAFRKMGVWLSGRDAMLKYVD
jgi:butyryl-CoA dehydrogenase